MDILETSYGEWMTEAELVSQVQMVRPGARRGTIHRAVQRLTHHETGVVAITATYDIAIEVQRDHIDNNPRTRLRVAERGYWGQEATG